MATSPNDGNERRRVTLRRGRGGGTGMGGFSGGGTGRVESLRDSHEDEHDEVDAIIDPGEYHERVQARAQLPAPVTPDDARDNPRSRLSEVAMAGSSSYAKEYRLDLLHRLLMRKTPLDQIARQLGVSISTIEKDRITLKKRMREQAKELNIDEMIGDRMGYYDEVQAMAMRIASAGGDQVVPTPMKLAALRTSLAANADRARFLTNAGVFDVLRFRRAEDGDDRSDVQQLMDRTREMLERLDEPEAEAPRRRVSRRKAGGFKPLGFDDADASSSDNEVQEL